MTDSGPTFDPTILEQTDSTHQQKVLDKPDTRDHTLETAKEIIVDATSKKRTKRRKYKSIRTTTNEFKVARYRSTVDFDLLIALTMKALAFQRRVSLATYMRDVLVAHTCLVADLDQAIFQQVLPAGTKLEPPPERWAGYLASLGFSPAVELQMQAIPHDVPPPPRDAPEHPVPQVDVVGANIETIAKVETVEMRDYTVERERQQKAEEAQNPPPRKPEIGWGSAAQAYGFGYTPSEITPDQPLREQHEAAVQEERKRQVQDPI